ncbi:hypothetical protein HYPSUDRAFT_370540 [Hypholoma sublateritium FD-334 SS-4]|uniref:Zn(2)-C6 fungal-type domain-containing protein n=1 Tax=Hypholoma sublateritium (strain FD-334 SS-4) TaxID=945553 RepID=A0A0D2LWZ8_HYPSF|nr:hypothetical protein HYPSUDRAFT_370540 [Hypholoma sublateritium FD-334 SS-4]
MSQNSIKCSGEHPSCKRCITRGLACEYAKEGRVRGPNKPKPKANATSTASPTSSTSTAASAAMNSETTPTSSKTGDYGARAGPHRSQSSHSSGGSSDETPMEASSHSLFLPTSPGGRDVQSSHSEYPYRQSVSNSPPLSSPSFSRGRRPGIDSGPIPSTTSRHSSLGEHPSPRSHLMDVHLEPASSLYRLSGAAIGDEGRSRLGSSSRDIRTSDIVPRMAVHSLPPDTHLYPYQHPLQPRDQQRDAPEHSYLSETIGSRPRQVSPLSPYPIPPAAETCLSRSLASGVSISTPRPTRPVISNAA